MMFLSLKRLLSHKKTLDNSTLAYIEGTANAEQSQRVRERLKASPEQADDVESLRATVSLLHSVGQAKAPRSFALREAPAPVVYRRPWYTQAPAMAAATAVLAVGILVASDLGGALRQSGRSAQAPVAEFQSLTGTGARGTEGLPGELGLEGTSGPEEQPQKSSTQDASPDSSGTVTPTPTQIAVAPAISPQGTPAPETTLAPRLITATVTPGDVAGGYGITEDQATALAAAESNVAQDATGLSITSAPAPGEGAALPLWQIEAALAAFAVLMLGAWGYLRRAKS